MNIFIETITSSDPIKRNRSFFEMSRGLTASQLLQALLELDGFRKRTTSLYDKVRAILFLHAGFHYHQPSLQILIRERPRRRALFVYQKGTVTALYGRQGSAAVLRG